MIRAYELFYRAFLYVTHYHLGWLWRHGPRARRDEHNHSVCTEGCNCTPEQCKINGGPGPVV